MGIDMPVFRTTVTAFINSTGDKTLSSFDIQDVLEVSKRLSCPISLLLEPGAKRAKLNLSKTKLPTAKALAPMNPTGVKAAFTALARQLKESQINLIQSEMKVEELDLSSVDLQLATIKLVIDQRNGNHLDTLMNANTRLTEDLGKLKFQPPALVKAKQDKVTQLFNYFSPDLSKLSNGIQTGIMASLGGILEFFKACSTQTPDEINLVFNANGEEDSYGDNNDEDKDKDNIGREGIKALHQWNKVCDRCANKKFKKKCEQCQETCSSKNSNKRKSLKKKKGRKAEEASNEDSKSVEKKGEEKLIKNGINLDNQTPERTLQVIAAIDNMIVEQLLYGNNILKDENPEKLPAEKLQQPGIKNEITKMEEKDNEKDSKDKVDEEEVAPVPAVQENDKDKNEEEEEKNTASDPKDVLVEKKKHGKIIYQQVCHHGGQNEW
eukprot:jgi/Psemu1/433/gm1.433_g